MDKSLIDEIRRTRATLRHPVTIVIDLSRQLRVNTTGHPEVLRSPYICGRVGLEKNERRLMKRCRAWEKQCESH